MTETEIRNRWNAMSDVRGAIIKSGLDIPNAKVELQRIIDQNDIARLTLLESKITEWDTEVALSNGLEAKQKVGSIKRELCNKVLDLVSFTKSTM